MEVLDQPLEGLKLIRPNVFFDERGYFLETYRESRYKSSGVAVSFVQDNHSFSKKGTIRGMHFQSFPGQAKLVKVVEGEIYDVVVDIRPHSPTFKQWKGFVLDSKKHEQLFIPVGFAHGFAVLSETAHVTYKVSTPYDAAHEKTFRYNDPEIGIKWPVENPIVSARDLESPFFKQVT